MSHRELNKIKTLSPKEAAEYTKETGNKIPHLTSMLILIIFFLVRFQLCIHTFPKIIQ